MKQGQLLLLLFLLGGICRARRGAGAGAGGARRTWKPDPNEWPRDPEVPEIPLPPNPLGPNPQG